ncbi:BTB/POZ domain-containing protein 6-B-like isoform X2 [Paramacrobiotus metropolitanus]|nr:BTB/POZ domain-containing protein 6-B-like isoform X2 [Paramacrobiotus metropolitanus]
MLYLYERENEFSFPKMSHSPTSSQNPELVHDGQGFLSSVKRSLVSGELADVQFMVGRQFGDGKLFSAHKYVLGLRNPVFRAMLYGDLAENCEKPIDIPDVPAEAFANLLSFLYTDDVVELSVENVIPTWMCADKYGVPQLVDICCDFVSTELTVDNCLTILENGIEWHAEEIVKRCLRFIDRYAEGVLQSEHFVAIGHKTLVMILQSGTLFASEHSVYLAVERWALEACKVNNVDPSGANRRQILGDALFLVRFPLLTHTQLADGPVKSGLLLHSEVHDLYQHKFATVKPSLPFSADARQTSTFRIADTELQYAQPVFVHLHQHAKVWHPAEIVGVEEDKFRYTWLVPCGASYGGCDSSGEILPASQFLKPGQEMVAFINGGHRNGAIYRRVNGDQHVVQFDHQEYT